MTRLRRSARQRDVDALLRRARETGAPIEPAALLALRRKHSVRGVVAGVASRVVSEASLVVGAEVSGRVYSDRLDSCRSCPMARPSAAVIGERYCAACVCGDRRGATVERKALMPYAACPLRRAGWSNAPTTCEEGGAS